MRVWLDDMRKPPFGWEWAKTATAAIDLLKTGKVEEISLDHDLKEIHYGGGAADDGETGYAVVLFMHAAKIWPGVIKVHSLSPSGSQRMMAALLRWAPSGTLMQRVKPREA